MTRAVASPSVRALASRKGIDLDSLAQKLGRETLGREDIETAESGVLPEAAAFWDVDHAAFGPVTIEPVPRLAQVASRNLAAANSLIPAVTHHEEADITAVEAFRTSIRSAAAARGIKLTPLSFHVAILTRCLKAFPRFNTSLGSDGQSLVLKHFVHVGVAVDTPHGLVVPVVRNTDRKSLYAIASEIADLAERARKRKVRPHEMGGASMTITNLGGIGGSAFSPIVNPPEVAILGISRSRVRPVWDGTAFRPVPMVPLDLSYDHRVINGADAARFLAHYAELLAEPRRLLL